MRKDIATELAEYAEERAKVLSRKGRQGNNGETFEVAEIIPLCEMVAIIEFRKDSGKYVLMLAMYIDSSPGRWVNIIPTDSHLLGLRSPEINKRKETIEKFNFKYNFN